MLKETGKLVYGLEYNGQMYFDYTVKPLTLADELQALEVIEETSLIKDASNAKKAILTTLAYWAQQLEVSGITAENLSVEFLLHNLASEDYQSILTSMETLRSKSIAAGQSDPAASEQANSNVTLK
ncbi:MULTISPECIES: hypothetical protein [Snodgrassella]|jgi:hypothetical protein|uniref:hypothetical protein n=1 Tax=Snodgrassella TaxID=1193515 RepID=UPI0004D47AE3|nr:MULTISPECIES: hypothetical protein [Snodgrassella]KES10437.1 hypothetical protein SASC598O11_010490 [Snodgrassella alvi SCGC AB-598-O11]MBI0067562.1 hypothetical protein [Snodgrassella sp. M0110]MBI0076474.1 hypothetical protein [Snodgrassella sp. M0118]MBI0078862.1 hypothetical protein [Snodgrassella sp. M0112]NUF78202.1 hypothetical protein [Snodgrassella sp. ESL0323]